VIGLRPGDGVQPDHRVQQDAQLVVVPVRPAQQLQVDLLQARSGVQPCSAAYNLRQRS
jgi:hypothetical protein